MKAEKLNQGQHEIGYAYPTSDLATKAGLATKGSFFYTRGCYFYTTDPSHKSITPFASFEEAEAYAKSQGTAPHRYSLDHEKNAKFRVSLNKEKEGV